MVLREEDASHLGHVPVMPALRRLRKCKASLRSAARLFQNERRRSERGERSQAGKNGSLVQAGPASYSQYRIAKEMLFVFGETRIRETAIRTYI